MISWIKALFNRPHHIWKVEREEYLGSFIDFNPGGCDRIYRIAVYETCLVTGDKRIRERHDYFPAP